MPDPFSDGGHATGEDGAAINAALWELSAHGRHAVAVQDIAAYAALVGGWERANEHLNHWHNKGGFKGQLPSGQRFRPDRTGKGNTARWVFVDVGSIPPRPSPIRPAWPKSKLIGWLGNHVAQIIGAVVAGLILWWLTK